MGFCLGVADVGAHAAVAGGLFSAGKKAETPIESGSAVSHEVREGQVTVPLSATGSTTTTGNTRQLILS